MQTFITPKKEKRVDIALLRRYGNVCTCKRTDHQIFPRRHRIAATLERSLEPVESVEIDKVGAADARQNGTEASIQALPAKRHAHAKSSHFFSAKTKRRVSPYQPSSRTMSRIAARGLVARRSSSTAWRRNEMRFRRALVVRVFLHLEVSFEPCRVERKRSWR